MRFGTSQALARVSATSPVAGRLEAARRVVEGRFLEAGEVLAQAVDGVGKLISSLDNLTKTLDPVTVEATAAELKTAAASLLTLPDRHAGRRDVVARLARRGDDLAGCIEDMKRNLAYLRVFAINIKITAGGVAAAGTEFGLFAQEICDCIELGRTQLTTFDKDLRALSGELKTAFAHEQGLAQHCDSLLPAVPDGLAASAEALTAHHAQVSRAAAEVGALARAVSKKVGQALAALQIGDITRQRIEHVQQGLDMLAEVEGLAPEPRGRLETFIHRLMAEQLRAAGADFHRDVARIGTSMAGMAADASEILRLRDLAFGRSDAASGGFLGQMETHVAQALELVGQVEQADATAARTGAAAAAAVGELSAQIAGLQAIKTDVQQMALNTTLKCSRIGETGKPLAVIAVELRTQAGHLEITAHQALTALQGLAEDASGLDHAGGEAETGAGQVLSDAAVRLKQVGAAVEADLVSLAKQGEGVVEALRRAAARLDFQREIGATLDEAADALEQMAGDETPWTDDLIEVLGPLLDRIAKTYTMAQERETQRQATQHLDLDAVVEAPAAAAADDDLLF